MTASRWNARIGRIGRYDIRRRRIARRRIGRYGIRRRRTGRLGIGRHGRGMLRIAHVPGA